MNLQFQNKDTERSLEAAKKALKIQPDSTAALTHIFWREIEARNWKRALEIIVLLKPPVANFAEQKEQFKNREIGLCYLVADNASEENEKIIFDNIKKLKQKKTVIIISHNLKNLKNCGKTYLIKNGDLIEKNFN